MTKVASAAGAGLMECKRMKTRWLINAPIDLLFVCGFAPLLLGALVVALSGGHIGAAREKPELLALTAPYIVAALVIGEAHQFTSILRLFFGKRKIKLTTRQRIPFIWWWVVAVVGAALGPITTIFPHLLSDLPVPSYALVVPFFATLFLQALFPIFLVHHFCEQARAITLTYCALNEYKLSDFSKRSLSAASLLFTLGASLSLSGPFAMRTPVIDHVYAVGMLFIFCGIAISVIPVVRTAYRTLEWPPLPAVLTWSSMAGLLAFPFGPMLFVWVFAPILYHSTQHWALAYHVAKKEAVAANEQPLSDLWIAAKLVLPVQAVTLCVLFFPLLVDHARATTPAVGTAGILGLQASMMVFALHYLSDRYVWRN